METKSPNQMYREYKKRFLHHNMDGDTDGNGMLSFKEWWELQKQKGNVDELGKIILDKADTVVNKVLGQPNGFPGDNTPPPPPPPPAEKPFPWLGLGIAVVGVTAAFLIIRHFVKKSSK